MRSLLIPIAIVSLSLLGVGCGQAAGTGERSPWVASHRQRSTPARANGTAASANGTSATGVSNSESVPRYAGVPRYPGDDDADNDHNDDENIPTFGHEASSSDRRAMVATLKRYYAAVVRNDGARACAMFTAIFRKSVPLEYGRYGAPFERGSTCGGVVSKVFRHFHRQLLIEATKMRVIDVRLEGEKGYVVVRPHAPCVREMCVLNLRELLIAKLPLRWEGGSWKVEALFLKV